MSTGLASLGAALVALAVAAPALRAETGSPAGVALLVVGAGQLAWGLLALAARRTPASPLALGVPLLAAATWAACALTGSGAGAGTSGRAAALAVVLTLAVVPLALLARHGRLPGRRAPVTALVVVALAVAALVALAVAATPSAEAPHPHGVLAPSEELREVEHGGHP